MPKLELTLARVLCKMDIAPKSILYYGRPESFAAKFYPKEYPDWELGTNVIRLLDYKRNRRLTLEPSTIFFEAEPPSDMQAVRTHVFAAMDDYLSSVTGGDPTRSGLRMIFLQENGHRQAA